jgi:hypothetical protein
MDVRDRTMDDDRAMRDGSMDDRSVSARRRCAACVVDATRADDGLSLTVQGQQGARRQNCEDQRSHSFPPIQRQKKITQHKAAIRINTRTISALVFVQFGQIGVGI